MKEPRSRHELETTDPELWELLGLDAGGPPLADGFLEKLRRRLEPRPQLRPWGLLAGALAASLLAAWIFHDREGGGGNRPELAIASPEVEAVLDRLEALTESDSLALDLRAATEVNDGFLGG